jgi:hypothetical protein
MANYYFVSQYAINVNKQAIFGNCAAGKWNIAGYWDWIVRCLGAILNP